MRLLYFIKKAVENHPVTQELHVDFKLIGRPYNRPTFWVPDRHNIRLNQLRHNLPTLVWIMPTAAN